MAKLASLPDHLQDEAGRLFASIADAPDEIAVFVYLDRRQALLGIRQVRGGSADRLDLPVREVVRDALAFEASGIVMAHNHPGGDPAPTREDRDATRLLVRALDPLGVRLIDHWVVAARGVVSFRALGLL